MKTDKKSMDDIMGIECLPPSYFTNNRVKFVPITRSYLVKLGTVVQIPTALLLAEKFTTKNLETSVIQTPFGYKTYKELRNLDGVLLCGGLISGLGLIILGVAAFKKAAGYISKDKKFVPYSERQPKKGEYYI